MKFLTLCLFFFAVTARAEIPVKLSADANFEKLVQLSVEKGQRLETEGGTYLVLSFISFIKDENGISRHEYFSSVGGYDETGSFQVGHVEVVAESWSLDASQNSIIDQWIFISSSSGAITDAKHFIVTESQKHQILSETELPLDKNQIQIAWDLERNQLECEAAPPK